MELVDAPHSKCGTFGFVGSSPTAPTSLMDTYSRFPLRLIKGNGVWVWDENGEKYLDAVAGIATCSLGHSNRRLKRSLINQLKKIQHVSNLYHIPEQEELADWLVKRSCAKSIFFCNSGAEANEAAIKLARKYAQTKRGIDSPIILSAHSSFHGRTIASLSATGQPKYHKGFEPLLDGFQFFTFNDQSSFKVLHDQINKNSSRVAAVLIEPIQGEGGLNPGNKEFFKVIRDICTEKEILLILDEVQTGMGRTGKLWCYEHLGIEPDAFTLAKGLGGGHAIGALLVNEKANIFQPGDHASTFGGNPFACKAALTVGHEIERLNLLENVQLRGAEIEEGLIKLVSYFPNFLKGARGLGLMQGIIIKEDCELKAKTVIQKALKEKLLIISAGEKVVRLLPPLTISKKEVRILLERLNLTFNSIQ